MKFVFIVLGFASFSLGLIGVWLPFLPTTPFILFSVICFAKSSKKFEAWIKTTNLYKNNIESLQRKEGLTKARKIRILVSLTVVFALAAFFMRNTKIGRICLAVVWFAHIIGFTFFIKTNREDKNNKI